jgi:hypothetical protein
MRFQQAGDDCQSGGAHMLLSLAAPLSIIATPTLIFISIRHDGPLNSNPPIHNSAIELSKDGVVGPSGNPMEQTSIPKKGHFVKRYMKYFLANLS